MNNPSHGSPPSNGHSAFTLIELLVVITIIGIMAVAGAAALGGNSKSLQGATAAASTVFGLARTEAILKNSDVLVLVDTSYNPAKPENYLRRMTVVTTNGTQIAKWTTLPGNAYFNEQWSTKTNSTNVSNLPGAAGSGPYKFYKFKANGQADGHAQFVLSTGTLSGGAFTTNANSTLYGFYIHKMGKHTFFTDPASIPQP